PGPEKRCGEVRSLVLHHDTFRGNLGNVHLQQKPVALQQKSPAQELAKVNLQQKNPSLQPEKSSRLLKRVFCSKTNRSGIRAEVI
ncbi:MAG TPA: hypothetical protein VHK68_10370, partial [Gemmatimonadales bacterium]|nr:hypothetical protein [Gemmatimonadales bacterium]